MLAQMLLSRSGKDFDLGSEPVPMAEPSFVKPKRKKHKRGHSSVDHKYNTEQSIPPAGFDTTATWENAECAGKDIRRDAQLICRRPFTAAASPPPKLYIELPKRDDRGSVVGVGLSLPRRRPAAKKGESHGRCRMFQGETGGVSLVWPTGRRKSNRIRPVADAPAVPEELSGRDARCAEDAKYQASKALMLAGTRAKKLEPVQQVLRPPGYEAGLSEEDLGRLNHYRMPPWDKSPAWRAQLCPHRFSTPPPLTSDFLRMHQVKRPPKRTPSEAKRMQDIAPLISSLKRRVAAGRGTVGGFYTDHSGHLQSMHARNGFVPTKP
eukprot:TRINITY_DN5509_c0_g1_i1.p1 TRINITY_DN5509_c0_g1~~TRINITY_DN5509_c0_g1_i1.p1  ORF type:complete len:322 (+),score=28.39 TRINITY_DN5509_c0_g1_i1:66-1031(+)